MTRRIPPAVRPVRDGAPGAPESASSLFSDWYWVLDRDLRYRSISGRGDQHNGTNAASLIGQKRFEGREFQALDMSNADFERVHAERRSYRDVRARIRTSDGTFHYIAISGEPLMGAGGAFEGYHGFTRDITAEYRAQEALRESEARFRDLLALSSDFYWETDTAHCLTVRSAGGASEALAALGGTAIFGKTRWELPSLSPGPEGWQAHRADLDARRSFRGFEFSRPAQDGRVFHFSISGEPRFDAAGAFIGYRGVGTDITERKRVEQLHALEHAATRVLAEAAEAGAGMRALIRAICEAQGWDFGRYWRPDHPAASLRLGEAWGLPEPAIQRYLERTQGTEFPQGIGLVGQVYATGEPILVEDLSRDPRVLQKDLVKETGLRGACNIPVKFDGGTIGVLGFVGRLVRAEDARLLAAMSAIGAQVGQFLMRKQAEAQLRRNEERFRSLIALSSDLYWETDREHRLVVREANDSEEADFAVPSRASIGKRRWELPSQSPDANGWRELQATMDAHLPFWNFEFSRMRPDGTVRHTSISGEPVFDAAGEFAGYRGIGSNITRRKREERLLAMEHAIARCLSAAENVPAALQAAIRIACEANGWACGRYWQLDESAGVMRAAQAWSIADAGVERYLQHSAALEIAPGQGVVGRVLQSGETAWIRDLARDARVVQPELVRESGLHGACIVPVFADGGTMGALAFVGKVAREPDERLLGALRTAGSQLGQFLKRAESQARLRANEERFRSLSELSSDWYWEQDAELRFVAFSGGNVSGKWGQDQLKAVGLRRWEIPGVEPVNTTWDEHRAVCEARRPFRDLIYRRTREDGSPNYVSASGHPVYDQAGRFTGYRGVATDITQRKREELLRGLEHAVARILAGDDEPATALDKVLQAICEANEVDCARYFEYDEKADAMRYLASAGTDPATVQRFLVESGQREFRLGEGVIGRVWQSGEPIWITDLQQHPHFRNAAAARAAGMRCAFMSPVLSAGRTTGVIAFFSRYARAQDALMMQTARALGSQLGQFLRRKRDEESLRRFRAALDGAGDAIVLIDRRDLRYVDVNRMFCELVGLSREEIVGRTVMELTSVDRASLERDYDAIIADAASPARRALGEFRGKDGGLIAVETHRRALQTKDGWLIVASARDIRDRVAKEQALRESIERFDIVARATNDVVWDWNLATDELWWNPNYYSVFGFSPEQTSRLSDSWKAFIHPEDLERVVQGVYGAMNEDGATWSAEYRFRRVDGTYLDIFDRGLFIRDAGGKAVRAIGAMMDISARKRAEREAAAQSSRQARLARFGQFALQRHGPDGLIREAVQRLGETMDAVALFEEAADGQLMLRAAHGHGTEPSVGRSVPLEAGSAARHVLAEGGTVKVDADYCVACPESWPWAAWMRNMRSGAFVPVTHDGHAYGMLAIFSRGEGAIGSDDMQFAEAMGHVLSTALQREQAEQRLAFLAQFDSLTGLPNRGLLEDRLKQTTAQSGRQGHHAAVLFVDLDRFKLVNDTLGHQAGDAMIREVARRLERSVRAGDTVARLSGDEFAVVLADLGNPEHAGVVAQKVLDALAAPFDLDGSETFVTASIGISVHPSDGDDAETLIRNADMAMYKAKQSARNCYRFFTARMNERAVEKMRLGTDLRHAMERGEFSLQYQPKVDLQSGAVVGLEALLRWNHPQRGPVSPAEFVPALESSGLILPVGEWVLQEACEQIRRWQAAGLDPVPVAVNLSVKQFRRPNLDAIVQRILAAAQVPASLLELEITESGIADDPEDAVRQLKNLREAGLTIAIDDFGTGYSSLAYLSHMPLSSLKIDRSFTSRMLDEPATMTLVQTMISLAHSLRLKVVAEGVETEAQARILRLLRCDQMQGYLFSRPLPGPELEKLLARAGNAGAA